MFWSRIALIARIIVWGGIFAFVMMAIGSKSQSSTGAYALGLVGAFCGAIAGLAFNSLGARSDKSDKDP